MIIASLIVDAVPLPVPAEHAFPGTAMSEWRALTLSGLNDYGEFQPNLSCFLVRWGDQTILCDTGLGPGPNAYLGGLEGHLLDRLGVAPEDIDLVIFTHLHMDHVGWATSPDVTGNRRATFPNARYVVAREEYQFWAAHPASARQHHIEAFETAFRPLEALGCLRAVEFDEAIVPNVSLMATPGHTPGHAAVMFTEPGETLVVAGDLFHCPGQIERPDFCHRADMAPEIARQTRTEFIKQCALEGWRIGAGHFRGGLQIGTIETQGEKFVFVPSRTNSPDPGGSGSPKGD